VIRFFFLAGAMLMFAGPARAQDAAAGGQVFRSQCSICHSAQAGKNSIGPSLFGVAGRPAGSVADFHYSDGNKSSGITWDQATLDRFLAAPRATIPGTKMAYAGVKNDQQRHDLVAYLATLR
jgi:cytochrome c